MIAKDEKKKKSKMGIAGIIEAANKVAIPSQKSPRSSSTASILSASPPTSPVHKKMSMRFKKFADSIKNTTKVWPRTQQFEEMHNAENSGSNTSNESLPSYYLNNLISERTHGMGRAMNMQQEDFVELELEVGAAQTSSPSGTRRTAPAQIKRSRTLSMSMEDRSALAAELEKRRPTYVSLEVTRADLKTINQKQSNIFRRSFDKLAVKPRKSSGTKSVSMSPVEKTINVEFERLKPPNLALPPYPSNDYFVPSLSPTQKSTKLMEFHRMMGVRSNSLIPAMERTIVDFVKKENAMSDEKRDSIISKDAETSKFDDSDLITQNESSETTRKVGKALDSPNLPAASSALSAKPSIPPTRRSLQTSSPDHPIPLPAQWQPVTRIEILDDQSTRICIDPDSNIASPSSANLITKNSESPSTNPYSVVDLTGLEK